MYFFVAVFLLAVLDPGPALAPASPSALATAPAATSASPSPSPAPSGDDIDALMRDEPRRERAGAAKRAKEIAAAKRVVAVLERTEPASPLVPFALRALGYADERDGRIFDAINADIDALRLDRAAKRSQATAVDAVFAARDALQLHLYGRVRSFYGFALVQLQHPGDVESPLANEARLGLARENIRIGRWSDADESITRAERFDSRLRPWNDYTRGEDLVARGDLELGREHYAKALADFERGEEHEEHLAGVRGVAFSTDAAPGLTNALIGLDADWASLTVSSLGDELLIANESLKALEDGSLEPPGLAEVAVASAHAMIAADVFSPTDTLKALSSLRASDRYAGSTGVGTAEAYRVLGDLRFGRREYAAADAAYRAARAAYGAALGTRFPQLGELDGALARTALQRGRPVDAIRLAKASLHASGEFGLADGPVAQATTVVLARSEDADGRVVAAAADYARSLAMIRAVLARSGTFLTERQRVRFLKTASVAIDGYAAFLVSRRPPGATGTLYDVALFGKEIVAGSVASVYASSGTDSTVQALRAQLARVRRRVSQREYGGSDSALEVYEADLTEADLADAVARRDRMPAQRPVRWQDVRAALAPREAAVEYLRIGSSYVALILRASAREPAFVSLGSANDVARDVDAYASSVAPGGAGDPASTRSLYARVWAPLVPALGAASRVYLAADGALDQIAFSILQRADGADLIDLVDLRQLTSTKDLLATTLRSDAKSAVIFADPAFDARVAENGALPTPDPLAADLARRATVPARTVAVADESRIAVRGGSLRPLPETEDELRDVAGLLDARGWTVDAYSNEAATKPALEAVRHPRILHVATHGFVLRDAPPRQPNEPTDYTDPMQRSMLFLSGAGRTWSKEDPPNSGLDNGVLTAYEATSIDLRGTELVVLSACETGLGRIEGGEGVLGLRRAFQQAGAQFVLSTLWQIPSPDTVELLDLFYAKWLGGENKYDALRDAQRTMRARAIAKTGHDDPRTWGAFVLVGNGRG